MVSSAFPTTLEENDYRAFAQYLLGLEIGFIVIGVVLSIILLALYIKFGVSKAEPIAFRSSTRCTVMGIFILFVVVNVVMCALGWVYNSQCDKGVKSGFDNVQAAITTSQLRVLDMNDTITNLVGGLDSDIAEGENIVNNLGSLLNPLYNIVDVLELVQTEIQSIAQDLNLTVGCFNQILVDLGSLKSEQDKGHISGVPDASQVPKIDQSDFTAIDTAFDDVNQTYSIADGAISTLNASLADLSQLVLSEIPQVTNTYTEKANQVTELLTSGSGHITNATIEFQDFRFSAQHYSTIRTQVVNAILIAPIVVCALALVGLFLKMKILLQLAYIFVFIIMFWYWAIAGINLLAYTAVNGFCGSQEVLLQAYVDTLHQNFTIPGQNVTIDVGPKLPYVLKCSGDTTFVDIFDVSFLIDELNGEIKTQVDKLGQLQSEFNKTDVFQSGIDTVEDFINSTNIDFTHGRNLSDVISALDGVSAQLNNLTNFGFPEQQYEESLQAVNDITNDLTLNNGTVVHLYYNASNILSLNPSADPFTKTDQQTQDNLRGKAETAQNLTRYRNDVLEQISYVQANITDTQHQLTIAQGYIDDIQTSSNKITQYGGDVINDLQQMLNSTQLTIDKINALAADFQKKISDALQAFIKDTSCAFIGTAYAGVTSSVCTQIAPTFKIITATMIVNAVSFFVLGILGAWVVSRMKRDLLSS